MRASVSLVGILNGANSLENSLAVPKYYRVCHWDPAVQFWGLTARELKYSTIKSVYRFYPHSYYSNQKQTQVMPILMNTLTRMWHILSDEIVFGSKNDMCSILQHGWTPMLRVKKKPLHVTSVLRKYVPNRPVSENCRKEVSDYRGWRVGTAMELTAGLVIIIFWWKGGWTLSLSVVRRMVVQPVNMLEHIESEQRSIGVTFMV